MSNPAPMRPFTASLPMALLSAREVAMRFFRPLLAEHDLTEQQWRVLRALSAQEAEEDPADAGQIAAATCLLPPSLSRILDHLEGRGLVTREIDPLDQRRSLLGLSTSGRRKVAQVAPASERRYEDIETAFGSDRLANLLAELNDFARVVDVGSHAGGGTEESEVANDAA